MISTLQHCQDLSLLFCNTLGADEALTPGPGAVKLSKAACWVVLSARPTVIGKDVQEPDKGRDGRLASGGGSLDQTPIVQKAQPRQNSL